MLQSVFKQSRPVHFVFSAALLLSCMTSERASANDSTALLEAGGIRLTENYSISLDVEDLYISADQIRIHYEFVNTADYDIKTLVAFPVPEIDSFPDAQYSVQSDDPINFLNFSVTANGVAIKPEIEIKLTVNGVDFTDDILASGLPLSRFSPDYYDRLEKMPEANRRILADKGLIDWEPGVDFYGTNWKMQTIYHWWQTFPAKSRTIIDHAYQPVVGSSFYSTEYEDPAQLERFCPDDGFIQSMRNKIIQSGNTYAEVDELKYILQTANNWMGPIGDFRLVIDKGAPGDLVSLCINDIRKIAPTEFEFRAKDFVPDQDLDILFFKQPESQGE
ncbi:DUF4424 family protein [uncultured Cohaesibacter sp.]|uniref:DUF4424 family protein n=1 Tax=uncultured Cohaesibacter sp. TaxID=1002546 RepID=UPI00292CB226|nr:DUF4424 family protein [uncultured Cohaesibacter sp.]